MSRIYVQSEYVIPATPEEVYASLIDFQNARPSILTDNFVDYTVEQGGMGEGTVIRYQLQAAGRKRDYRMHIAETLKGEVLTERDSNSSLLTMWTLTPVNDGQQTHVQLVTEWEGGSGVGGFFERTFAPLGLRRIYNKMLGSLAQKHDPSYRSSETGGSMVEAVARAGLLGLATGIRSMTPVALLSWTSSASEEASSPVDSVLKSPVSRAVTTAAALGEIVVDKLPITPSRTSPGPLLGRMVIGGVVGMILCQRLRQPIVPGIVSGAAGAGIGSVASTLSRAWLSQTTKTPQALWGSAEDIEAVGLGLLSVNAD
jgi:uncharacterized membrane protein